MPTLFGCLVKWEEMFKVQLAVLWTFHDKIKVTVEAVNVKLITVLLLYKHAYHKDNIIDIIIRQKLL